MSKTSNMKNENNCKMVVSNKKHYSKYYIIDKIKTGMVLNSSEIKALRLSLVNIDNSYACIINNEVFMYNSYIGLYSKNKKTHYNTFRARKLLLRKKEIKKLTNFNKYKGYKLIPLNIIIYNNVAKVELTITKLSWAR